MPLASSVCESAVSGVIKGGKGVSKLGRSILGAPNWGRNVCLVIIAKFQMSADADDYDAQYVDCQRLLPTCEILWSSPRFTERVVTNLSYVLKRSFWLQQSAPACGITHGCVAMLSDSQGLQTFRFAPIVHSCVVSGRESSVHSECSIQLRMLYSSNETYSMLLRQQNWCLGKFIPLMAWQTSCYMYVMWCWRQLWWFLFWDIDELRKFLGFYI